MKRIIYLLIISLLITLPNLNVDAAVNPYKKESKYGTNCTWYAWDKAYEIGGVALPGFGNAKNWLKDAETNGFTTGLLPRNNSIVVWADWTDYGHVGYVERAEGNKYYVWESNSGPDFDVTYIEPEYSECEANSSQETYHLCRKYVVYSNYRAREMSMDDPIHKPTGFIYLDGVRKNIGTTKAKTTKTTKINKTTTISKIKSNNNNLSNLSISNVEISFDKETSSYEATVNNEIEKITIVAEAEDDKSSVDGIGEKTLQVGENIFKVIVTSEDNAKKEYEIKIIRKELEKEEYNVQSEEETSNSKNNYKLNWEIIIYVVCIIAVITFAIGIVIRKKKSK